MVRGTLKILITLLFSLTVLACGSEHDNSASLDNDLVEVDLDSELGAIPPLHAPDGDFDDAFKYFDSDSSYVSYDLETGDLDINYNLTILPGLMENVIQAIDPNLNAENTLISWAARELGGGQIGDVDRNNEIPLNRATTHNNDAEFILPSVPSSIEILIVVHKTSGGDVFRIALETPIGGIPAIVTDATLEGSGFGEHGGGSDTADNPDDDDTRTAPAR